MFERSTKYKKVECVRIHTVYIENTALNQTTCWITLVVSYSE